ncbi:MAG: hypothetical protein WCQ21_28940 [Verrucomicrobiota bacterium]
MNSLRANLTDLLAPLIPDAKLDAACTRLSGFPGNDGRIGAHKPRMGWNVVR